GSKILELLQTGKMQALEDIINRTPKGVLEMMQIKGSGPKKIAVIWREMGIESVGELEYACNENRLAAFKGFGAKTQESILQNIAFIRLNQNYRLWAEVENISNVLVSQLQKANPGKLFALSGEVRRQMPTIEFIDIITDVDATTLQKQFGVTQGVKTELQGNVLHVDAPNQPAIRLFLTDRDNFHQALFVNSASQEFITAFEAKYEILAAVQSEEEIFASNKLPYIIAPLREKATILEKAAANNLPQLIQPGDIKGIIHSHSTWSDGADTIEKMAKAAIEKGYEYLVISDHSQSAYYAQGLTPDRIAKQHIEIDALNAQLAPFKIFKSIEADILNDGRLDYNDDVLATFDLVIASVH
ncbi:MAG: PHP domain-containing protein, partial [Taibaiella sp.]|nr:PHP domain-containing protein [Taibaiella sp.]